MRRSGSGTVAHPIRQADVGAWQFVAASPRRGPILSMVYGSLRVHFDGWARVADTVANILVGTEPDALKTSFRQLPDAGIDAVEDMLAELNSGIARMTYAERMFRAGALIEDWSIRRVADDVVVDVKLAIGIEESPN